MALVVMLFQFLSPAFLPMIVQEIPTDKATEYHAQHTLIVVPTLLKEKDEKEDRDLNTLNESVVILDFTNQSFNLAVSHSPKHFKFAEEDAFISPLRFALFCTLLI